MNKLRKQLLPITTFIPIDVRRLFRDKVAIFFVFVFPLIFLLIFGFVFRGSDDVSFKVALLNHSDTEFARTFVEEAKKNEVLDIDEEISTMEQAREKMNRSELTATIVLPEDFGQVKNGKYPSGQAQVLYDQNNEQGGRTLASVMEATFEEVNKQFVPSEEPFTVKAESTATKGLTRFDYTFAGMLGFTLLSLGIFGPTTVFPRLKQRGVLRRYQVTTLKVWQYFTANVISNSVAGLIAVAIMFMFALVVFDLNMRGDYLSLIAVVILGTTLLFGIGLAIGGWAKNENQAAPLAQLATLPMMFLSGVFFPTFLMPEWLQNVAKYIPLTPIVDSVRMIVTEGRTVFDLGPQLLIMAAWTVVIYVVAFKVFRWE
jgi:ABC-2 type transport system permease protein